MDTLANAKNPTRDEVRALMSGGRRPAAPTAYGVTLPVSPMVRRALEARGGPGSILPRLPRASDLVGTAGDPDMDALLRRVMR